MSLFVDTSVWSLVFRRDSPSTAPEAERLNEALDGRERIYTTGLVLQELLQGFRGPRRERYVIERFAAFRLIVPTREDHIEAARLLRECRRRGVQTGTVDALLARLCIDRGLTMLSADRDFARIAEWTSLRLWRKLRP